MISGITSRPFESARLRRRIFHLAAALLALPLLTTAAQVEDQKARQPLEPIEIPGDTPPEVENPFKIKGRWMQAITVPAGKERVNEAIIIGDRMKKSWPTIVVAPGSNWSAGRGGRIELSGGNFVARKSRFDRLPIEVDHACRYFFINCAFDDCRFGKGGVWYGGDLAGKYYFESCIIRKTFANPINLTDTGFRIQTCVFENIDLPSMNFRKKEAADYVNERWLRVVNCRFVKCTLPISFLLLTRDCVFENCTLIEDREPMEELKKLIEIDLYMKDSKSKISAFPANVILNQKPDTALKGVEIPTVASLLPALAP